MNRTLNDIGLRNKIDQSSLGHDYLFKYQQLFQDRSVKSLGIILGTNSVPIANTFAEFLPEATVTAISYAPVADPNQLRSNVDLRMVDNLRAVHSVLAEVGPFDVLIEDSPNRKSQKREIFKQFFPHVRKGGTYIAEDLHASYIPSLLDDDKENLWELLNRLLMLKGSKGKVPADAEADDKQLAKLIQSIEFDGKFLCVHSGGDAVLKLRHSETTSILQNRYGATWGRVLSEKPSVSVRSKALVTANDLSTAKRKFPEVLNAPVLEVREYYDVVAQRRQILSKESYLLPDTFRLGLTRRLNNSALSPLNHYFSWRPNGASEAEQLEGQFYYLDLEYNGHFGHFMTEAIPRLYAWDEAKKRNPELKILISTPTPDRKLPNFQYQLLEAYGINKSDIHGFSAPVQVEALISAAPLFHNMNYVHPDLRATFERMSDALVTSERKFADRIFVSRKTGMWRECLNKEDLESVFVRRGFQIVYPEDLSIPEQATLFANAKVVAGYIGSGLYGAIFALEPIDIIGFINTSYAATNEYLIATVLGHRMHNFWCEDVDNKRNYDSKGRPIGAHNSDFVFDFDKDGELLEELLDRL